MNQVPARAYDRLRARTEKGFSRWGEICHDHPWWIIIASLAVVAFVSLFLPNMEMDTSTESHLHPDDPARAAYDAFQREFGRDERIVVLVESDGDIVNEAFLRKLETLHHAIEKIPQVDKVDSLVNARLTLGRQDELIVRDLLEDWPANAEDFDRLRGTIRANPVYQKQFVNPDLTKTLVVVTPDTYTAGDAPDDEAFDFEAGFGDTPGEASPSETDEGQFLSSEELYTIIDSIEELAGQQSAQDFRIGLSGSPYLMHQMTYIIGRDMFVFSFVGIAVISLLLLAIYRRWVMVVLPISVAALSLYFTIVLMVFFGIKLTTSVQMLPSLLLAVGVSNSVHLFAVFYQGVDRGLDKRAALAYALGHSGLAIVMTGLTTAGGLASFMTANLKTVADIGLIGPMGILNTLLFTLLLLPALMAICPMSNRGIRDISSGPAQKFLAWCADVSTRFPRAMVLGWLIFLGLCLIPASQIKPSHFPLLWFKPDSPVRISTDTIGRDFGGSAYMEILVNSGEENGLHDPGLLHATDRALTFVDGLEVNGVRAGKTTSLLDINKELHQALNGNDANFYSIPDDRNLIAQELLLFENSGSDDLNDIVDSSFSKMRITVVLPFVDSLLYNDYLDQFEQGVREIIGDRAEVEFTGIVALLNRTVKVLLGDTIRSYTLAFLVIAPLMMLMVGSVRTGLVSMIPNIAPVIVTLALMSLTGIPLDAFTLLLGSIALGLAVDDTIHFMHNFQRYYSSHRDSRRAVQDTLRTAGEAMLMTTVVLVAGFLVNLAGSTINLQHFGILLAFCILVALLADLLLAPALMVLLIRFKEKYR